MRMGKPTPNIPASCLLTHGTDLAQTQESVKIPTLKLNQLSQAGLPPLHNDKQQP